MERYTDYKTNAIQWLDTIPSHWNVVKLKNYCKENKEKNLDNKEQNVLSLSYGNIIVKKNLYSGLLPESYSGYQIVNPGNIILRLTDLQNDHKSLRTGLVKEKGIITSAYVGLIVNGINPEYTRNLLHTYDILKVFYSMGGGLRQSMSYKDVANILVCVPPIDEQEKIVAFINNKTQKIDNFIKEKNKEIKLYEELIESYILTGGRNNINTITSWNNIFPDTWNMISGKGLFEEIHIKGISDERFLAVTQDSGLIYKDTDDVNFVTAEKKETQKLVCPGQFVISLRSFQGGIEYSDKKGLISPAYVVLKLKPEFDDEYHQMYYRFLLKSKPYIELLGSLSDSMRDGKSIKFNDIKYFRYPIPSKQALVEIYKLVKVYDIKKKAIKELEALLIEYKNRLIADAVTGQINVQNI